MIISIISTAINRPISIIMVLLGGALFGILSLFSLPQEFLPNIDIPQIVISTSFRNASPQEVRKLVTIPLEEGLSSVTGVKNINSVSRNGTSTIVLDFEWGTNMQKAAVETRSIIDNQYRILPQAAGKPLVLPISSKKNPLLVIAITPKENASIYQLKRNANKEIKTEIQQIQGVGSVILVGGLEQEIVLEVNLNKLQEKNLDIQSLQSLIQARNISYPVGTFIDGAKEFLVKTSSELHSIEELNTLKLPSQSNDTFSINVIGKAQFAEREQQSLFNYNGIESIGLLVYPQQGNHSISISKSVNELVANLRMQYPNYDFNIPYDASNEIKSNVNGVLISLLLGAFAAFLVVLWLIKNIKIACILIISLPFSLFITFIILKLFNISLNSLSLSGLSISIGMLIDNSVVVLENINTKLPNIKNKNQIKNTYIEATHEMAKSTFGSTITSIIVFLPLIFLPGLLGKLFQDLAITISTALLSSFFVAITVIPICYLFLLPNPLTKKYDLKPIPFQKSYEKHLKFFIRHPILFFIIMLVLLLASISSIYITKISLFPNNTEQRVNIQLQFPPNTSIKYISNVTSEVSQLIKSDERITKIYSRAGGEANDIFYWSNPYEKQEHLYLTIFFQESTFEDINSYLKQIFKNINAVVTIEPPNDKIAELLGLHQTGDSYYFNIDDIDTIEQSKKRLEESFPTSLFKEVNITPEEFAPQLIVEPNREPLIRTGNTPETLANYISSAIYGVYAGKMTINEYDYHIRIRIPEDKRNSVSYIEELFIPNSTGNQIVLKNIANIFYNTSPSQLIRVNKQDVLLTRLVPISNTSPEDIAPYTKDLFAIDQSIITENINYMLQILIFSVIFLYLFLGIQFESMVDPLIVLLSIPLSLVGVFISLAITGVPLTMYGILGILVLFGITVNNSIILKDTFKESQKIKKLTRGHIVSKSVLRFQPIVITTLTTIIALFPSAIGIFSRTQQPLAIVIIGGLLTSTVATLFLIPTISVFSIKK